jgi:hypothetical protein
MKRSSEWFAANIAILSEFFREVIYCAASRLAMAAGCATSLRKVEIEPSYCE